VLERDRLHARERERRAELADHVHGHLDVRVGAEAVELERARRGRRRRLALRHRVHARGEIRHGAVEALDLVLGKRPAAARELQGHAQLTPARLR
jgi:hypothetical protein